MIHVEERLTVDNYRDKYPVGGENIPDEHGRKMFAVECAGCHMVQLFRLSQRELDDWSEGKLIQSAMAMHDDECRELMISKTCDPCWADMFKEEEE